jgi:hypothetical protein
MDVVVPPSAGIVSQIALTRPSSAEDVKSSSAIVRKTVAAASMAV